MREILKEKQAENLNSICATANTGPGQDESTI